MIHRQCDYPASQSLSRPFKMPGFLAKATVPLPLFGKPDRVDISAAARQPEVTVPQRRCLPQSNVDGLLGHTLCAPTTAMALFLARPGRS